MILKNLEILYLSKCFRQFNETNSLFFFLAVSFYSYLCHKVRWTDFGRDFQVSMLGSRERGSYNLIIEPVFQQSGQHKTTIMLFILKRIWILAKLNLETRNLGDKSWILIIKATTASSLSGSGWQLEVAEKAKTKLVNAERRTLTYSKGTLSQKLSMQWSSSFIQSAEPDLFLSRLPCQQQNLQKHQKTQT